MNDPLMEDIKVKQKGQKNHIIMRNPFNQSVTINDKKEK